MNIINKVYTYALINRNNFSEEEIYTTAKEIMDQVDLTTDPGEYQSGWDLGDTYIMCRANLPVEEPKTPEEALRAVHYHKARVLAPLYIEYKKLNERYIQACEMLMNKHEPKLDGYRELGQKCAQLEEKYDEIKAYSDQRSSIHSETREELLRKIEENTSLNNDIIHKKDLLKEAKDLITQLTNEKPNVDSLMFLVRLEQLGIK